MTYWRCGRAISPRGIRGVPLGACFQAAQAGENADRELKLTAENLFVTLADPLTEATPESTRLLQFLALMLERKKILRPKGRSADRERNVYEHTKTKLLYEVPLGSSRRNSSWRCRSNSVCWSVRQNSKRAERRLPWSRWR